MALVVDHLTKRFGSVVALDDLTFEVAPGQVFGFLGANGAGKTTTMRIALGVLEADGGTRDLAAAPRATACPRSTFGLPAGGARPLPADARPRPAAVLRRAPRRAAGPRPPGGAWPGCAGSARRTSPTAAPSSSPRATSRRSSSSPPSSTSPQVLLMDEPFTGLDPVNVALLREAFLELRDRGRTVVFSTHQMEVAEALCESVAIVDRGRMVVGGPLRDVRRSTGRRMVRISVAGDHRLPWLARVPGARRDPGGHGPHRRWSWSPGSSRTPSWPRRSAPAPASSTSRSRIPSLEQVFIDHVGPSGRRGVHLAPVVGGRRVSMRRRRRGARPTSGSSPGGSSRERVRSRAFVFSTLLLAGPRRGGGAHPAGRPAGGQGDGLAGRRHGRRARARRAGRGHDGHVPQRAAPTPALAATKAVRLRGRTRTSGTAAAGGARRPAGRRRSSIERGADGGPATSRCSTSAGWRPDRAQLLQVGAFAVGILDWTASQPGRHAPVRHAHVQRGGRGDAAAAGSAAQAFDAADYASRRIVGIVFVVLSFLTLVFYGLWVASGVVAEKSSRVMELLISAATAQQLVVGKILGHRAGGADAGQPGPAARRARAARVGAASATRCWARTRAPAPSLSALSPGLLARVPRVLRARVRALRRAVRGGGLAALAARRTSRRWRCRSRSRRSRATCPAVLALSGGTSWFIRFASYVPLWSPFVMMARLAVGRVEPWELALSIGLCSRSRCRW